VRINCFIIAHLLSLYHIRSSASNTRPPRPHPHVYTVWHLCATVSFVCCLVFCLIMSRLCSLFLSYHVWVISSSIFVCPTLKVDSYLCAQGVWYLQRDCTSWLDLLRWWNQTHRTHKYEMNLSYLLYLFLSPLTSFFCNSSYQPWPLSIVSCFILSSLVWVFFLHEICSEPSTPIIRRCARFVTNFMKKEDPDKSRHNIDFYCLLNVSY
jgi:hypothetical protein